MASNVISKGAIKFRKLKFQVSKQDDEITHPFIYLNSNTSPQDVLSKYMVQEWKMGLPKIIVTLISNVKSLTAWKTQSIIQAFQKGVINAANSTEMWIFTPGFNVGVGKIVGDAVKDELKQVKVFGFRRKQRSKLTVIGICKETRIKQTELLNTGEEDKEVELETNGNSEKDKKFELNPYHTHFIIVKETKEKPSDSTPAGINDFQFNLIHLLSRTSQVDKEESKTSKDEHVDTNTLPVVSVVIQGGLESAQLVYSHIQRKIPVVILRGSGGLADILAFAYTEIRQRAEVTGNNNWDDRYIQQFIQPELTIRIRLLFPKFKQQPEKVKRFGDIVLEIIRFSFNQNQTYLTVLSIHKSSIDLTNLSQYLLKAIFRSQHADGSFVDDKVLFRRDLYLTLDWNCPMMAKTEVLANDDNAMSKIEKGIFESALLRTDREEFIGLFLQKGLQVHKLLNCARLRNLYRKVHDEEFWQTVCWGTILAHSQNQRQSKHFLENDLNYLIETLSGLVNFVDEETVNQNAMSMYAFTTEAGAERYAISLLAIWAALTNRPKLVKVLWKYTGQPIQLALVISTIFDRLSSYPEDGSKMKTDLEKQSQDFADMAVGVLEDAYVESPNRAMRVLSDPSQEWNGKSALDLAADGSVKQFIAHRCCQKRLTDIFYGKIRIRNLGLVPLSNFVKVLLSSLLIFPMYVWVRFPYHANQPKVADETKDDEEEEEEDLDKIVAKEKQPKAKTKMSGLSGGIENAIEPNRIKRIRKREVLIKNQPPLWLMIKWMWEAPVTKFWTLLFFYLLYLTLFSFAVLWPHCGNTYLDAILSFWTLLMGLDYIFHTYTLYMINSPFSLTYRLIEIFIIGTFVILYFTAQLANAETYSPFTRKIALCFGLQYFFYRLVFNYFLLSPVMGPLLYRIKLMVFVDFVNFLLLAMPVMIASGVALQAVLYPDMEFSGRMLRDAFHRTFMTIFYPLMDEVDGKTGCRRKEDIEEIKNMRCWVSDLEETCPNYGIWPYFFAFQFYILFKLILMTVLFAMFSATANRLSNQTDAIWKYQRYILITDFANRAPLPPPLILFYYEYVVVKWIISRTMGLCQKKKRSQGVMMKKSRFGVQEYNYWQALAKEYSEREEKKEDDKSLPKKQWRLLKRLNEEIGVTEELVRQSRSKMSAVERTLTLPRGGPRNQ